MRTTLVPFTIVFLVAVAVDSGALHRRGLASSADSAASMASVDTSFVPANRSLELIWFDDTGG